MRCVPDGQTKAMEMAVSTSPTNENAYPGYVYVASTQTLALKGIYKIGNASDIDRRLKELSSSTSAPEEFFDEYFVRCRTLDEAKRLETAVHKALDEVGARIRKGREFFRCGTIVGIVACIVETAKNMEISIVHNIKAEPAHILANDRQTVLSDENFDSLPRDHQAAYSRGVRDLSALMMLALDGEAGQAANYLYSSLSEQSREKIAPWNLVAAVTDAIRHSYGKDAARRFKNEVKECRDDDIRNSPLVDPRYPQEWPNYIRTDPNWPRVDV